MLQGLLPLMHLRAACACVDVTIAVIIPTHLAPADLAASNHMSTFIWTTEALIIYFCSYRSFAVLIQAETISFNVYIYLPNCIIDPLKDIGNFQWKIQLLRVYKSYFEMGI